MRWRSESGVAPPKRVVIADDTMTADSAYRLAAEGTALLWRSDFQNARQLLQALMRRIDRPRKVRRKPEAADPAPGAAFHRHRQAQAQRAHTLSMLLIPVEADYAIPLRRAPDVRLACTEAWG
ncbi:MAG: methylase, partial [Proteobacteria bacterium]|nr:methylase [Pseudomonadota bacterium]